MAGSDGLRCDLTIYSERACCGSGEPDLRYRIARLRQDASFPSDAQQRCIIALWLISGTTVVSRKEAAWHISAYFFRKRFELAIARECQGARSEVIVALPRPETSRAADVAAASAFSFAIRRYSAGEQSFCKIKNDRRVIVSQDANIRSLIITASDNPWRCLRRLRPFMTETFC